MSKSKTIPFMNKNELEIELAALQTQLGEKGSNLVKNSLTLSYSDFITEKKEIQRIEDRIDLVQKFLTTF